MEKIKYFAYLRKSSEAEEKQALSIPAQKDKIKELFGDLDVVDYFEESHSAFHPYNRPLFAKMIERINKGEASGIVTWHPDRLSRNEVDAATITYALRTGLIKDLKFGSYTFINSPEGIWMLQMALSQSQYSSAKLGTDVKRGLEKKLKMGWLPSEAPTGYLNFVNIETAEHIIIKDPDRFDLVRKMWDLMLTGNYNPTKILEIANNKWGFTTLKRRKRGGGPLARSSIYAMFTNPFYAGVILNKGVEYPGKHEAMVSLDEFDQAQILLGRKGKPRPKTHFFPFTGQIRCGVCGCLVTAEMHTKIIKNANRMKSFTYYHCTHKKKWCKQRNITKDDLEIQIEREINKMVILPVFRGWALDIVKRRSDQEVGDRTKIYQSQQKTINDTQAELDNLLAMKLRLLVDDDEYLKKKQELKAKKAKLLEELNDTDRRADKWMELGERFFDFVTYVLKAFEEDNLQQKKEILAALGQNYVLKDGILKITSNEWFIPIIERYPTLESEYRRLEPALAGAPTGLDESKKEALRLLRLEWRGRPDSNRRSPP
ncbi:MAG: hypothetical protein HW405_593 [Candidatus Berkelbacteria bacterium]|nr:hypothetical protein [Candidatus Berkelbacteria bacterium]